MSKKIGTDVFAKKDKVKPIRPTEEEKRELEQLKAKKLEEQKAKFELKAGKIEGELAHEEVNGEKPYDSGYKSKVIQLAPKECEKDGYVEVETETQRVKLPKKKK